MKRSVKTLGMTAALIASMAVMFSGCSEVVESASTIAAARAAATPFGVVADTSTNNTVRVAWGHPGSMPSAWYFYIDGTKVGETSTFAQYTIENVSAGSHKLGIAAVDGSGVSSAAELDITVSGTVYSSSSSSDPYSQNSSIAAPFGAVVDTNDAGYIAITWGMPSSRPDSWAIYLDGSYVNSTTVCTRFPVAASNGNHEIGVAAVSGSQRSEITSLSATVTGGSSSSSSSSSSVSSNGLTSGATYNVIAKCSGKGLDVADWSTSLSTNIHQWSLGDNQANQQWILTQQSDGSWTIVSKWSGYSLDAENWGTTSGTNVLQWNNYAQANQRWWIEKVDGDWCKVINVHSGLALDVSSSSTDDGANVQTWAWNASSAQLWKFQAVGTSSSSSSSSSSSNNNETGNTTYTSQSSTTLANGISTATNDSLVGRNNGMKCVFQFQNCTNGRWSDDQIYVYIICINPNTGAWSYGKPDGTLVTIGDSTSDSWYFKLSQAKNVQMPKATAARIYYSYGAPLSMKGVNGGVQMPSLANTGDPNYNTYFDWLEFTIADNGTWVNTTQVDQLGFPVLMNVYGSDGSVQQTGISAKRDSIWSAYKAEMPDAFDTLCGTYRIVAPAKGAFDERTGGAYGSYFDNYVTETWNTIASKSQTVNHPQGKFTMWGDGTNIYFYCVEAYGTICSAGTTYTVYGKPTTSQVLEGYGVLASGNSMELALEAWLCAALNRHVCHLDPSAWNDASQYYKAEPCNMYSKFFHDHSERGGLAYGFCYDDVNDQSATTYCGDAKNIIVRLGF